MTLEFALLGNVFFLVIVLIMGGGVFLWANSVLQLAASQTARCVAIGSPDCSNRQTYASSVINAWGAGSIITTITVSVQSKVACNSSAGLFTSVTITDTVGLLGQIIPALSGVVLTASACYPSRA